MITRERIKEGIQRGCVRFVTDPNMENGTVCKIGECWFYFGGLTAEEENPAEFLQNADMDEVVADIYETLESFRTGGEEGQDEYAYYDVYLKEYRPSMDPLDRVFCYYLNEGKISGIVVADNEEDAASKVLAAYKSSPYKAKRNVTDVIISKVSDMEYQGLSPDVLETKNANF